MTHNTDCTVRDGSRQQVQEIAERIWNRSRSVRYLDDSFIEDIEQETGWDWLGAGLARTTFQVSEGQADATDPVKAAPCVIKFAKSQLGRDISNGQDQNQEEIANFRDFPDAIIDPDSGVPVAVPLKDWDKQRQLWISLPLVDPDGGSRREVEEWLENYNWTCRDLHPDNVGLIHNTSIMIDYGADCSPTGPQVPPKASDLADELESFNAKAVDVDAGRNQTADVQFWPPSGVPGDDPFTESFFEVVADDVESGRFAFGKFDTSGLAEMGERVAGRVRDRHDVDITPDVRLQGLEGELVFDVLPGGRRVGLREPFLVYVDVVDAMQTVFGATGMPGGTTADQVASEVAEELRDVGVRRPDIGSPLELPGGRQADRAVRFFPQLMGATVGAPTQASVFNVTEDGVILMLLYFGAWPNKPSGDFDRRGFGRTLEQADTRLSVSQVVFEEDNGTWNLKIEAVPERGAYDPERAAEIYQTVANRVRDQFPLSSPTEPSDGAITREVQGAITRAIARRARDN